MDGQALRRLRELEGISQAALAVRARTSQSYISRVEEGEISPSLGRFRQLFRCLGYDLEPRLRRLTQRSDPYSRPEALVMSPEERIQSMAALHNVVVELRAGMGNG